MKRFRFVLGLLLSSIFLSACILNDWKVKAGLQVMITNDIPSSVYLDGKYLDTTPYINKEIKPGDYIMEIRPNDATYATYQTKISLRKGVLTVVTWKPGNRPETSGGVTYEMEPLKNNKQSELSLVTVPDGAIVRVDGQAKGFAPVLVENISTGEHEYEVTLPSYETQKHTINILEGYRMDVTIKLAKLQYTADQLQPAASSSGTVITASPQPVASSAAKTTSTASDSAKVSTLPLPKVKILHTGFFVAGKEVLKVRDSAGSTGNEIGTAPIDSEYPYLKETKDGWYKISFNNAVGWVSQRYAQLIQ